jgi:hypothetical protein
MKVELRTRMVTLRSISTPALPENKQSQRIEWQQQRHHTDNSSNHVCGDDAAFGISKASGTMLGHSMSAQTRMHARTHTQMPGSKVSSTFVMLVLELREATVGCRV